MPFGHASLPVSTAPTNVNQIRGRNPGSQHGPEGSRHTDYTGDAINTLRCRRVLIPCAWPRFTFCISPLLSSDSAGIQARSIPRIPQCAESFRASSLANTSKIN